MLNNLSLIGFDFSIAKPACCIYYNNEYSFISWPKDLVNNLISLYKDCNINIINRENNEKEPKDSSEKIRYEIKDTNYMCDLIINSIKPYITNNTKIAFEGSSFGSKGNVVIQLTSRRYMLMNKLTSLIPLENMYTFAPITVKKIAECSKKGSTKNDVINSFINIGPNCLLRKKLKENKTIFMKKGFKNFQTHLDDIIDSYFVLETLRSKILFN